MHETPTLGPITKFHHDIIRSDASTTSTNPRFVSNTLTTSSSRRIVIGARHDPRPLAWCAETTVARRFSSGDGRWFSDSRRRGVTSFRRRNYRRSVIAVNVICRINWSLLHNPVVAGLACCVVIRWRRGKSSTPMQHRLQRQAAGCRRPPTMLFGLEINARYYLSRLTTRLTTSPVADRSTHWRATSDGRASVCSFPSISIFHYPSPDPAHLQPLSRRPIHYSWRVS